LPVFILLLPLNCIFGICTFFDVGRPIFYQQTRVGKDGKHFTLVKFRNMNNKTDADGKLLPPSQRVTKFGKFMRKLSLDELLNFWSVLKGDMSIVGPRPALWNQYDLIEERDKYGANDVTPGLTGWAQVNGRDELDIEEKARLDGEYVRNLSFAMDLKCFLRTITAVIRAEGVAGEDKK
jgi:O-antigen biosynthesis protein WbqP